MSAKEIYEHVEAEGEGMDKDIVMLIASAVMALVRLAMAIVDYCRKK